MNQRNVHRFCMLLLAFAISVRVLCATGVEARATQALRAWERAPWLLAAVLRCEQEQEQLDPQPQKVWVVELAAQPQEKQPDIPQSQDMPQTGQTQPQAEAPIQAQEIQPQPEPQDIEPQPSAALAFSESEADAITIGGACSYAVDKQALLTRESALDFSVPGPKVLIVHTHSSEAYTPEAGWEYTPSDTLRTTDAARSVIRVGDEIAAVLNERGIETLHDTALNDYPSYDGAYARMQETIGRYLAEYPSIQMVIDVHRDAAEDAAGNPVALKQTVADEACAQLMLVVGTDEGGLEHPNWQENLANALKLQALLNRSAPGLCRDLDLRTERFNQNLTPGSILCEFGATGNTLLEAVRSGRIFGEALAELIEGIA